MPTIEIDKELYKVLDEQRTYLKEKRNCSNASFGNAIREFIGMRHIGKGGNPDSCNPTIEQFRTTRVSLGTEKELNE
jgi:hypothetical protein